MKIAESAACAGTPKSGSVARPKASSQFESALLRPVSRPTKSSSVLASLLKPELALRIMSYPPYAIVYAADNGSDPAATAIALIVTADVTVIGCV